MLVNMSRFIRVQQVIKEHIEEIQNNFIQILKYNFDEDTSKNAHLSLYKELKRLWKKHFDNITDICFIDVIKKKNLLGAVFDIEADVPKMEIIVVNGSSASKLDYKSNSSLRSNCYWRTCSFARSHIRGLTCKLFLSKHCNI